MRIHIAPNRARIYEDIELERLRQSLRYDNTHTEDGTGPDTRWLLPFSTASAVKIEQALRTDYEDFEEEAPVTWVHLLREEMSEAFMEDDPVMLRAEVLQVAALCVSWVERMDKR